MIINIISQNICTQIKIICYLICINFVSCFQAFGQDRGQGVNPTISERPNIILILVDDMGYSDPGCYGGEIETPNIDFLAENGLRFNNFHNTGKCSPTRAALLTGVYQHIAGVSRIGHSLGRNVVTIAEALKRGGYQTGMTGKWHLSLTNGLGNKNETLRWVGHLDYFDIPFSPLYTYPVNRGFDEHYGIIWGVVNQYDPFSLVHNEEPIINIPDDFLLTEFISEKTNLLIDQFSEEDSPFFLYVAYASPHWPLHARQSNIEKYNGVYNDGWEVLRRERYERQIDMGLFDEKNALMATEEMNEGDVHITPQRFNIDWNTLEHKDWEIANMKIHAAMVDEIDQGIGSIIKKLKDINELDNTIIMFLSDNGASPERIGKYPIFHKTKWLRNGDTTSYLVDPTVGYPTGMEDQWAFLGRNWAGAVNTPFRYWKSESYEGGIATPFIIFWPEGLDVSPGTITDEYGHIMDVMPTLLDITNIEYPIRFNNQLIDTLNGKSLLPILKGNGREGYSEIYYEVDGGKAMVEGDWKISSLANSNWDLFNIKLDRTETHNLSKVYPEKVEAMGKKWQKWYRKVTNPNIKR